MRWLTWPSLMVLLAATPINAQVLQIYKGVQLVRKLMELRLSDEEEQELGASVSEKIRVRYGVVQDRGVHRYVTLVGSLAARRSSRPALPWRFIVLDTDGVNAFAAPGGYIHITRGALGLIASEAELAAVLAHEIAHVTEKHTLKAMQKAKLAEIGAEQAAGGRFVLTHVIDKATELVMTGFGRGEELESDRVGVRLVNQVGYAPGGLAAFLKRLRDRNKTAAQRQGLFGSHPEMQERIEKLEKQRTAEKLNAQATLEARYRTTITYRTRPQAQIATVTAGAAGLVGGSAGARDNKAATATKTGESKDAKEKKRRGFSLSALRLPGSREKQAAEVTGSGGARGVDVERNAKGGAVPTMVVVKLTAAEIAAFAKQGNLKASPATKPRKGP